jgi:hypothetical protein
MKDPIDGRKARSYLVDIDTGEVTDYVYEGDKINRSPANKYSRRRVFNMKHKNFVSVNADEFLLWQPHLSTHELALIATMESYASFGDCRLRDKGNDDLHITDIINSSPMRKADILAAFNGLEEKHIVHRFDCGGGYKGVYVNPWIFCKGISISSKLHSIFKDYKILSKGGTLWKDYYVTIVNSDGPEIVDPDDAAIDDDFMKRTLDWIDKEGAKNRDKISHQNKKASIERNKKDKTTNLEDKRYVRT